MASREAPTDWEGSMAAAGSVQRPSSPIRPSMVSRLHGGFEVGREVAVERGERLAGACGAGDLDGRVEAVEPQPVLRGAVPVVLPHPGDQLVVRVQLPEPVAEAAFHRIV